MFNKSLKKALAVVMTSAVIASSAVSLPVYAAISASDPMISQVYSIPNYDPMREFHPKRHGDIISYGKNNLLFSWGNTNRIPTGIWGSVGEKIKVYVQANNDDPLPSLYFVQHYGMWQDLGLEKTIPLKAGVNEITVPQTYSDMSKFDVPVEAGSCIYILNPYTEQQQSNNVRVYIEGGDKFPVFRKGDDYRAFSKEVKEYYSHYSKGEKGYHNAVEICGDHAFITFTLERVYDAVVKEGLSPQTAIENTDDFLCYLMDFDDITASEYQNIYQHIKVNQPYAGAYAYFNIIGIQDNNWSGSLFSGNYGWGFPHEYGHIIDNSKKVLNEVTNNVYALKYVLENELYADIAISKPLSDPNTLSANETTTLWSVEPRGYTGVYMLWDLEVYHEGLNGMLDDMLRNNSCGDKTIDSYLANCSNAEKVAAYASKIAGTDLTYYFKKYGYLTSFSGNYTNAVNAMNLAKTQPKLWYYDVDAYIKSRGNNLNIYTKPSLSNYETSTKTMYFNVPSEAAANHLGFEIMKDGKFVAYVWDNKYSNSNLSGTYTVNAYDRSLNVYASFTVNTSDSSMTDKYVAKTGSASYRTLEEAIKAAPDKSTVYLLESASVKNTINLDGKNITLMPADEKNQVVIYNSVAQNANVFSLTNGASLTVRTKGGINNAIVFDGQDKSSLSYFKLNASTLNLGKGVTVRRCKASSEGSAAGAFEGSEINLAGCLIERNYTDNRGTFFLAKSILNSSDNTVIRYNRSKLSGSVIQAYYDNIIDITDTQIYKNYNNNKDDYGTIRLLGSTLVLGNGTVIRGNQSDWYNMASAVLTDNSSEVEIWGTVNIPDIISTSVAVEVSPQVKGNITVRPNSEYSKKDNVIFKPLSGNLTSDTLKKISLISNDFYLDISNKNTFYLSDTAPLINDSTFSGKSFCVGDTLKMYTSAHGGNGSYTYSYEFCIYDEDDISDGGLIIALNPDKNVHEFKFESKGKYGFIIIAKDSSGKTAYTKENICEVSDKLTNKSALSSNTISLGSSVTVKPSAQGGTGGYQYAVYYKKTTDNSWTKIQDYSSTVTGKITPKYAKDYVVRVKVKDNAGHVTNRDLELKVNEKLSNTSTLSATSIDIGNTVTVKASAKGGVAPFKYAVLYKKTSESKWTNKQDFSANQTVSVKPSSAMTYDVCVKVKDSKGTIEKKYFTLTVNKGIENKSTLSADTIKLGNSVTVKCDAAGGSGFYNYAVFYKKTSESKWTKTQDYSANSKVSITPSTATTYDICVKARDNTNRETKKYFTLTVTNADLANQSKISASEIKVNGTVKITGAAFGGTSPYQYAFYYKDINGSTWTKKQDFGTNTSVSVKFTKAGVYNICAKVQDSKGTVAKKYFTVTVEK